MKEEDKLKQTYGTQTGFRVPDEYFDHVFAEIGSKLPDVPQNSEPISPSRWQRLKPYIYLAAMFGGIWCTMKMVSMLSGTEPQTVSLDNPPQLVAQAMSTPEVVTQVYSEPSVMLVTDEYSDSYVQADTTTETSDDTEIAPTDDEHADDDYSSFMNIADVDLNQLQAALMEDDSPEDYYYYI